MKTTVLLIAVIAASLSHSAIAEGNGNVPSPPGPYRSINDVDQYATNKNDQYGSQLREGRGYFPDPSSQLNRDVPVWVQQRREQMERRMRLPNMPQPQVGSNQPPPQVWSNQPPQWNYNQIPPRQNFYTGRAPGPQGNRMQQPFPPARGPAYGPGVPPQEFYPRQGYQVPRY